MVFKLINNWPGFFVNGAEIMSRQHNRGLPLPRPDADPDKRALYLKLNPAHEVFHAREESPK